MIVVLSKHGTTNRHHRLRIPGLWRSIGHLQAVGSDEPTGHGGGRDCHHAGYAPTNLSFHLKVMAHAGLVAAKQEGRFQRYRANLPLMSDLITYLTDECCGGRPELCALPSACS